MHHSNRFNQGGSATLDAYKGCTPAQLIAFAQNRIAKGLLYSSDMRSSRELCFADGSSLIERAIQMADAVSDCHRELADYLGEEA